MKKKICVVVGTRPGIIMMAPIIQELIKRKVPHFLIHTGQHYSPEMDTDLFQDLNLPNPDFRIEGISNHKTHATQTGAMMAGCEGIFMENRPSLVIVNGDANTNLAAALAARKLGIPLAHSEAGERSYDWRMPEEHNRRIMDHISELLFATNQHAFDVLKSENVPGRVFVTGNTIVDASIMHAKISGQKSSVLEDYKLRSGEYVLFTTHRQENVDDPNTLAAIVNGVDLGLKSLGLKGAFPIHPRTKKNLELFGLMELVNLSNNIITMPPMRYLCFLELLKNSSMVVTDSGGVQQEAFIHMRPCVTVRTTTEWNETVEKKGNVIAGASDPEHIAHKIKESAHNKEIEWGAVFGEVGVSARIVDICLDFLKNERLHLQAQ